MTTSDRASEQVAVPGLVVAGGLLCGAAGLCCGLFAILDRGDYAGGGVCLLAGSLAFGLLGLAVFRT